ncbi:thioesterase family protein [Plesiocystis pacifica SIR-1]|uniref:Thioesterase family protein n=1 Tax=Plesiocystis pacifica SIR-1 TaxID=391625 RepID=A6FXY1_9BACT|nr:thioesterase family protein [Plesiocystis pacifica]EDM81360.1 thioesterase family protein [Plesiocystis pacifica SIR-1]
MSRRRLVTDERVGPKAGLTRAAHQRVIYADTDRMGVVYHATYLRYLEYARVEYIRGMGFAYADLERLGYGLPVIDLAVSYVAPAVYDDLVSVWVTMAKLSPARITFVYRLTVEPGDRHAFEGPEPIEVLRAETRHGCMGLDDLRAARFPDEVYPLLEARWDALGRE